MKTKRFICFAIAITLIVSALCAGFTFNNKTDKMKNDYTWPTNENGETYGFFYIDDDETEYHPDLERVHGSAMILPDGSTDLETVGYIKRTDDDPYMGLQPPRSAEDALRYDNELLELAYAAKANGREFVFYIPVYESDGVTVVGSYGIGRATSIINHLEISFD